MPVWKLNIFKRAVIIRFEGGEGTIEKIVATYTKLSADEQQEVVTAVNAELNSK